MQLSSSHSTTVIIIFFFFFFRFGISSLPKELPDHMLADQHKRKPGGHWGRASGTLALCSLTRRITPAPKCFSPRQRRQLRPVPGGCICPLSPQPLPPGAHGREPPAARNATASSPSVVQPLTRFGLPGARQERGAVRLLLLIVHRRTPKQGPHDSRRADVLMLLFSQQCSREDIPSVV